MTRTAARAVDVSSTALRGLRAAAPVGFADAVLERVGLAPGDLFVLVESPAGTLFVSFSDAGINAVWPTALFDDDPARFVARHLEETGRVATATTRPPAGLRSALRTGRGGTLRYDLAGLSPFERAVLAKTLEIPAGEVRPYGWVAREIGRPRAMRAVGSALGRNPVPVLIPCHRVVRSDGRVGNYGFGPPMKRALLHAEGVDVEHLERLADARVRFVGSERTGVFCVPSCVHARRITARHEARFRSAGAALGAGYRPCPHCVPVSARDAS